MKKIYCFVRTNIISHYYPFYFYKNETDISNIQDVNLVFGFKDEHRHYISECPKDLIKFHIACYTLISDKINNKNKAT